MSTGSPGPPPGARLLLTREDGSLQELPLTRAELLVGRGEEADIVIDQPLVSREHARLVWQDGGYVLIDLGSTNQTRVNGERVLRTRLEPGDELRFARAVCRYELPSGNTGHRPEPEPQPEPQPGS